MFGDFVIHANIKDVGLFCTDVRIMLLAFYKIKLVSRLVVLVITTTTTAQ
jgi:hypothetical protein